MGMLSQGQCQKPAGHNSSAGFQNNHHRFLALYRSGSKNGQSCGKWWIWYNPGSAATLLHLWLVALVTYFPPKNKYFSIADSLL